MSNVQSIRGATGAKSIGDISVRPRVFLGFGLVLLMLAALAGFSVFLIRCIDADFRVSQSIVNEKSMATDMDLVMQKGAGPGQSMAAQFECGFRQAGG